MSVEQAEQEDSSFPTSSYKFARDNGEMQDLYRRTLTASYSADGQDLPADECIEDIFAGGDGWGRKTNKVTFKFQHGGNDDSDEESLSPTKLQVPKFSQKATRVQKGPAARSSAERRTSDSRAKPASLHTTEQQANSSGSEEHKQHEYIRQHDVSEFDLRDDLRSWHISTT